MWQVSGTGYFLLFMLHASYYTTTRMTRVFVWGKEVKSTGRSFGWAIGVLFS